MFHGGVGHSVGRSCPSGTMLVHTFMLEQVQVSLIYIVYLLGELKVDVASHFFCPI